MKSHFASVVSILVMSAWPHVARAEGESRELAAEGRFVDGLRLMKAGNCSEALPRFRESQELSPASGTLLNIGYCEAAIGHPARAWLAYRRALSLAEATGKANHATMAKSEAEQLEAKLGWLSLRISDGRRWALSLDSEPLPDSATVSELPTDPGTHTLNGSVAGKVLFQRVVSVAPGQHLTVEVADVSTAEQSPGAVTPHQPPRPPPKPPEPLARTEESRAPLYLFIGGGALVASGIAVFVHARYRYDSANCPNNQCVGAPKDDRVAAKTESIVSYALAGAGVALGGIALGLELSTSSPKSGKATTVVRVSASPSGLGVSGAF